MYVRQSINSSQVCNFQIPRFFSSFTRLLIFYNKVCDTIDSNDTDFSIDKMGRYTQAIQQTEASA